MLQALLAVASIVGGVHAAGDYDGIDQRQICRRGNQSVYDFTFKNVYDNETLSMSQFRGKLTLVVNVALYWGKVCACRVWCIARYLICIFQKVLVEIKKCFSLYTRFN